MSLSSFLFPLLVLAVTIAIASINNGVSAFFHLDQEGFGKPTRTILPDGRVHWKYPESQNSEFPTTGFAARLPPVVANSSEHRKQLAHFSFKAEVIMQAHWEVFDVSEHTDSSSLVCHEYGDMNLRMSIFKPSSSLLTALKTKPHSVVLVADANKLKCHGNPILRRVYQVHFFNEEILLITHRASYEHIFDEADINIEIAHPNLTDLEYDSITGYQKEGISFDHDATDKGVHPDSSHKPTTVGAAVIPKSSNTMMKKEMAKTNSQNDLSKFFTRQEEDSSALARSGDAQGLFKKIKSGFKKAVSKTKTVVKTVKKVVKNPRSYIKKGIKSVSKVISSTGSNLLKNIAGGVKKAYNAVANALTINANLNLGKSFTFSRSKGTKLGVVSISSTVKFTTSFSFKLRISKNKLEQVRMVLSGSLKADAAVGFNVHKRFSDEAQTALTEINGPKITFAIGFLPVYVETSLPISVGFEFEFEMKASARAGFGISAYAQAGVEYNRGKGFTQIANRKFDTSKYLKYSASIDATIFPYVQVSARFALYSFVPGYGTITFGLETRIHNFGSCDIDINARYVIKFSASLGIEIAIGSIDIYTKEFGNVQLFSYSWPAFDLCLDLKKAAKNLIAYGTAGMTGPQEQEQQLLALPSPVSSSSRHAQIQDDTTTTSAQTQMEWDQSGHVWTTEIVCPQNSEDLVDISAQGYFLDNLTVMYLSISRNISYPDGNYSLVNQGSFYWFESNFTLDLKTRAFYVPATDSGFQELGLDYFTVQNMEGFATGSEDLRPLDLPYIDIIVSPTSLQDISISHPSFCQQTAVAKGSNKSSTEPPNPPPDSEMSRTIRSLDQKVGEAFIRLVTDSIIIVLILAILEALFAWKAPKIIGEKYYPSVTSKATGREKVWAISATVLCSFCFVIFLSGMTRSYAQIIGLRVETNYSNPERPSVFSPPAFYNNTEADDDGSNDGQPRSSLLKASGLEAVIWTFSGAKAKVQNCPQYAPCYPDKICHDLCVTTYDGSWANAQWPYCPGSSLSAEDRGSYNSECYAEASDVYSHVTFLCLFFLCIIPPVFYFSTVYRRLPLSHACLMIVGLNMSLLWHRVDSFMHEVAADNFEPAASMVVGYQLFLDADSQWLMRMGAILLFVLIGVYALCIVFECFVASKEEVERRHFHRTFEEKNNSAELVDVEQCAKSSTTSYKKNNSDDQQDDKERFLL